MEAATSSSSSSELSPKRYDVFISFRGEDTRTNFTSHLHTALCKNNKETFIDYRLHRGDEISQALLQAIQDSSISVVVFSDNYASSKWCLDELTHILHCKKDHGQFVIPVFYKVDPSHVGKQNGSYKKALEKHERDFYHNYEKVCKWKHALSETANLAGWDSRTCRDESELIQNIVNDILQKLDHICPSELGDLVGIDENCQGIELLLQNAPVVGIWGMGGIGKTTMAKAVFSKLSSQFESSCFLKNIREELEKHGLNYIQDKLISELLDDQNFHGSTSNVLGSTYVRRRLGRKKVFIVLDDINNSRQLDDLARQCDCLGPNSKVLVTTRNKHVLIGKVKEIYEAKTLSGHESLKLFCFKAFHNDHPSKGFEHLSKRAVDYAQGIPLALSVLGSFFYSKTKEEWDSALNKLKKIPNEEIQNVLRLSYEGLNYEEKQIFLDISCFLKGERKERVITLLDNCGFHAHIGIRTLLDKALISISNGKIQMQDLIQKMGWKIVRQESMKEPGKRSRLWDPEEVYDVLKRNQGTDAVEGITLDMSKIRDIYLSVDTFKDLSNLRFLKFHFPGFSKSLSSTVHLPLGLESFSDKIRHLQWDGFPIASLPSSFCAEKLVEFHMPCSNVKTLWNGVQNLVNLKEINLHGSKQLIELPDLSRASNLKVVILNSCESLCHVDPSILSLHTLDTLLLCGCKKLESLQSENHLKFLKYLIVTCCWNLKKFAVSSEKMKNLDLKYTGIRNLHSSFGRSIKLESLSLSIDNLPVDGLCCLRSLKRLSLHNCREVNDKTKLHIIFDSLRSLQDLKLDNCCNLIELPDNMKHLSELQVLSLRQCWRLRSLPQLPSSIVSIDATDCTSLETIVFTPTTSSLLERRLSSSKLFVFKNCMKLHDDSLEGIMESVNFFLEDYYGSIGIPGSRVPKCFKYRAAHTSVTVELPPPSHLSYFVFCVVIRPFSFGNYHTEIEYGFHLDDGTLVRWRIRPSLYAGMEGLNSDHVFIWCQKGFSRELLQKYEEHRGYDVCASCNTKVTFNFHVDGNLYRREDMSEDWIINLDYMIKECGVCPIYTSAFHDSILPRLLWNSDEKEAAPGIQNSDSHEFIFPPPRIGTWKLGIEGLKDILVKNIGGYFSRRKATIIEQEKIIDIESQGSLSEAISQQDSLRRASEKEAFKKGSLC